MVDSNFFYTERPRSPTACSLTEISENLLYYSIFIFRRLTFIFSSYTLIKKCTSEIIGATGLIFTNNMVEVRST